MVSEIKAKINKIKFLLSDVEKDNIQKFLLKGSFSVKVRNRLNLEIDQILEEEMRILRDLKEKKISVLKKLEHFVLSDYKKLMKKAKELFEKSLNLVEMNKLEESINNL